MLSMCMSNIMSGNGVADFVLYGRDGTAMAGGVRLEGGLPQFRLQA
jgi:hypothetical protein